MVKRGWVYAAIREEIARWVDSLAQSNALNLRSRADVIDYALKRLREELEGRGGQLATERSVQELREELAKIRAQIERRR